MAHDAGAGGAVSDVAPRPQRIESWARRAELLDEAVEARVRGHTTGHLPQAADHAGGQVIPVEVQLTFGGVGEDRSQKIHTRVEVRGQCPGEGVRCEAVLATARDEGGHRELVDQADDVLADAFTAGEGAPVVACEFVQMRGGTGIQAQRERVAELLAALQAIATSEAAQLAALAEYLVRRSVWIVGGDGWAYDIGFGGLDHVLASGQDVNILVLDTEVYSNTGGQNSKATPLGAVAKFAAGGKPNRKKDLARIAMDYENVFVAQVAYGAKDVHTLKAFLDAESYPGVSIIIAYSPCIAHGVDLSCNLRQQDLAVKSGHWPLLRYDPRRREQGLNPLTVDSAAPSIPYRDFARHEARFTVLERLRPEAAGRLMDEAETAARHRHREYTDLAALALPGAETPAAEENSNA